MVFVNHSIFNIITRVLIFLDLIRSHLLKFFLKSNIFKTIFLNRSRRLFLYFALSSFLNLFLAFNYPIWILVFGPIVYGIPHLLSTIRYIPQSLSLKKSIKLESLQWIIGFSFLISFMSLYFNIKDRFAVIDKFSNGFELFIFSIFLGVLLYLAQKTTVRLFSMSLIFFLLIYGSVAEPLLTLAILLIGHNFLAFIFWFVRSRTLNDRWTSVFSFILFCLVHFFVLCGYLDSFIHFSIFSDPSSILNTQLGLEFLNQLNNSVEDYSRLITVFAYGQGVHYFIWLKAIPEQNLKHEHTINWKSSFNLLKSSVPIKMIMVSVLLILGLIGVGLMSNFSEARLLYVLFAAIHGYIEIVSLPFLKIRSV